MPCVYTAGLISAAIKRRHRAPLDAQKEEGSPENANQKALKSRQVTASVTEEHVLDRLYGVIDSLKGADPDASRTARLFSRGREQIAKKLGASFWQAQRDRKGQ